MQIRLARSEDVPRLIDVQASGGALFEAIGMGEPVLLDPPSPDVFGPPIEAGTLWLMADDDGLPVAHIAMTVVDADAHLAQVSVDTAHARQGIGRRLIDHAVTVSRADGFEHMTLTTYVDVPWNAPYYRRLGWRPLSIDELTPQLTAIRDHEASRGLDKWPRCAMTRAL